MNYTINDLPPLIADKIRSMAPADVDLSDPKQLESYINKLAYYGYMRRSYKYTPHYSGKLLNKAARRNLKNSAQTRQAQSMYESWRERKFGAAA